MIHPSWCLVWVTYLLRINSQNTASIAITRIKTYAISYANCEICQRYEWFYWYKWFCKYVWFCRNRWFCRRMILWTNDFVDTDDFVETDGRPSLPPPQQSFTPNKIFSPTIFYPQQNFSPNNILPPTIFLPPQYIYPKKIFPPLIIIVTPTKNRKANVWTPRQNS